MTAGSDWQHKQAIRARIEQQRRSLTRAWVDTTSSEIIARLENLPPFRAARVVHTSVAWRNEVNNHQLIKDLLTGRRVVVPVVDLASHTLAHSLISGFEDLRPGAFGILEPTPEKMHPVSLAQIDVILVPGVAFDLSGNRIGYGGGYYDDFLRQAKVLKIALCYHFQIVESIPTRVEDERVDILITEKGVHEFR
ncbi:MAG TPA: 5-formyltetrahydrofolate cyclo-ligase [bacterium]